MRANIIIALAGAVVAIAVSLAVAWYGPEILCQPATAEAIDIDALEPFDPPKVQEVVVAAAPDPELFAPSSDLVATIPPAAKAPTDPACVRYCVRLPPATKPQATK